MMKRVRNWIDPSIAKRQTLAKACMMTFEQYEPGRIIWEWLKDEHWDILTYHPDINIMMQKEARRQLVYELMELIEQGRKGEKKAVEVVT